MYFLFAGKEKDVTEMERNSMRREGTQEGQITMSTAMARAWVPRRKSAHVPLSRPRAFPRTGSTIDTPRGMIDAPAASNGLRISPPRIGNLFDKERKREKERFVYIRESIQGVLEFWNAFLAKNCSEFFLCQN